MKDLKRNILILTLVVLATAGCVKEVSKNVDQKKIWTNYELFYDQNTDSTYAQAMFRFSSSMGTRLKLTTPSNVSFNGQELPWNADLGAYQQPMNGMVDSGTFVWTDLDGNVYTNTIEIHTCDFPSLIDSLDHNDSVSYFAWSGLLLGLDERMELTVDGTGDSDARIFSSDQIASTAIGIDSLKLSQVTGGVVSLVLERKYRPALQEETDRGGQLTGRYRPTDRIGFLKN